nr:MAG TPA_asm: hypothetical protein [Caudoviricetes sp.]
MIPIHIEICPNAWILLHLLENTHVRNVVVAYVLLKASEK